MTAEPGVTSGSGAPQEQDAPTAGTRSEVLAGHSILVTGGSMGIGLACAEAALDAGATVVLAARGESALSTAKDRLSRRYPSRVHVIRADVGEPAEVEALFAGVLERLGRLDGVVHAAAVPGPIGPAADADADEWLAALRTNLFGTFLVARKAASIMQGRGGGRIVLFSGGGATAPFPNYSAYACSKAAVVRLAETLAVELAPWNVAVNCVAPGFVATRIHEATLAAGARAGEAYLERTRGELARGGVPATVGARAAVFLLSAAAAGITGRLLAAPWDDWQSWPGRVEEIRDSDFFTLRRIVPRDRGRAWQ